VDQRPDIVSSRSVQSYPVFAKVLLSAAADPAIELVEASIGQQRHALTSVQFPNSEKEILTQKGLAAHGIPEQIAPYRFPRIPSPGGMPAISWWQA
jgi:hypothetical protein